MEQNRDRAVYRPLSPQAANGKQPPDCLDCYFAPVDDLVFVPAVCFHHPDHRENNDSQQAKHHEGESQAEKRPTAELNPEFHFITPT
jgi:hypothetical protein